MSNIPFGIACKNIYTTWYIKCQENGWKKSLIVHCLSIDKKTVIFKN